jgi:hypothetical protein
MERTYTPGVCNLSDGEARRRTIAGWAGLVITLALGAYFFSAHVPTAVRLIIFIPAAFGAMGFLQGLMHFCVNFGMRGVFNTSNELGKTDTVAQAEYRKQDKAKAVRIIAYSVAIGILIAALVCII